MGVNEKSVGDLDTSSRNMPQYNESKIYCTQEEKMGLHGDSCTMTPNSSNPKAFQGNQMQSVEKDLPKFDIWVLGMPSQKEGKKGRMVQHRDL